MLLGAALLLAGPVVAEPQLHAGFARTDITPPVPETWVDVDKNGAFDPAIDTFADENGNGVFDAVYMAGFQNARAANGVHDPLQSVAAVFERGDTRIGLVTADVVGLSHEFADALRARVRSDLSFDYVLVHATHNHEGPDTQGLWGPGRFTSGVDPGYMAFLQDRMALALEQAAHALAPGRIEIAEIDGSDGRFGTVDTRKPEVNDDTLRVAIVRGLDGLVSGTLLNFGNHVELLWDRNYELTADVAGYARAALDRGLIYDGETFRQGLGGTTLWLTGNIGGLITTLPEVAVVDVRSGEGIRTPSFEKARAQGYALAGAVLDAVAAGAFVPIENPALRTHVRDIDVPIENAPLVLASVLGVLDREFAFSWGFETQSEVALIEIGDLWIACVPGELYPEIAIGGIVRAPGGDFDVEPVETPALRSRMSGRVNMMVNLANDALGYIIPRSQWDAEAPFLYDSEEETYGEIVSAGPDTARIVHGNLLEVFDAARGEP
jgi:hypothetical protein